MPGEHHRDEHAGDDVGAEVRRPVLVLDRHEDVEEVAVLLLGRRLVGAAVHDPLHQLDQPDAGRVAARGSSRCRRRGRRRRGRRCPARGRGRASAKRPSSCSRKRLPDEAGRRRVDRQLGEPVEQVDLAAVGRQRPTIRSTSAAMVSAWPRMNLSRRAWLWSALRRSSGDGVEHDALAEDRRHERVGLGLVEVLVGGPEEDLVGLGPGEQHDVAVGEAEHADVAALGAGALHQADRVDAAAPRGGRCRRGRPHRRRGAAGASSVSTAVMRFLPRELRARPRRG